MFSTMKSYYKGSFDLFVLTEYMKITWCEACAEQWDCEESIVTNLHKSWVNMSHHLFRNAQSNFLSVLLLYNGEPLRQEVHNQHSLPNLKQCTHYLLSGKHQIEFHSVFLLSNVFSNKIFPDNP